MEYSRSDVVFFEIKEMPSALLGELREFLRLRVIVPVNRSTEGDNGVGDTCYFSGSFNKKSAEAIEEWLQTKGFHPVQIRRN